MNGTLIQSSITRDIPIRSSDLGLALYRAAGINPAIVTGIEITLDVMEGFMYTGGWIDATFHIAVNVDDDHVKGDISALEALFNPFVKPIDGE